jgi:murein DD-endopeptidase MepM/ murein hydrolase activator NlpD
MQRQHTVIFVRHEGSQLRKWRLTTWQILAGALGLAGLLAVSGVTTWYFLTSRVDGVELARLKEENEKLRLTNQSFESRLQSLHNDLTASEDRTRQLAIVAGLGNLGSTSQGGVGGRTPAGAGTDALALAELESRIGTLAHTLDRVEIRLGDNLKLISSTPAVWPVRGLLSSSFGYRRDPITGQRAFHSGVDISAMPGKPVKATAAGVVVRTEEYGGLGRSVFVAHGYGLTTVYGHLSRIQVTPGQRVDRGDLIGLVGNTGRSTGYHLHYEIQLEGKPVNPLAYMLDGGRGES